MSAAVAPHIRSEPIVLIDMSVLSPSKAQAFFYDAHAGVCDSKAANNVWYRVDHDVKCTAIRASTP